MFSILFLCIFPLTILVRPLSFFPPNNPLKLRKQNNSLDENLNPIISSNNNPIRYHKWLHKTSLTLHLFGKEPSIYFWRGFLSQVWLAGRRLVNCEKSFPPACHIRFVTLYIKIRDNPFSKWTIHLNALINALCNAGRVDHARNYLMEMKKFKSWYSLL